MKHKIILHISVLLLSCNAFCQTYINNVTILDVEKMKLLPKQTVIVKDDIISAIVPSGKITIPVNATVIDGQGKFLLPGMTDAHVHFFQSGGLYTRPDAIDLRKDMPYDKELAWVHNNMEDLLHRYLRAGITNVIDVGSSISFLEQRDSFINRKDVPSIFITGPLATTWEPSVYVGLKKDEPFALVKNEKEARKSVLDQLPYHTDFIKVWYIVDRDSVEATARAFVPLFKIIVDEAHKHGLKVTVHATERITAQLAVENGCDFLVHQVEDEIVPDDFIKLLKRKNVILCPTLIVADGYDNTFAQRKNYTYYDLTTSNPTAIGSLLDLQHSSDTITVQKYYKWATSAKTVNASHHTDSIRMINTKKMIDAGITIAAGTDAGNIGTQHASSFVKELKAMQSSGLTNWQIIQSATINGAKVLGKENIFGSIAVGKKANMVLLDANPIDNLENLTKINTVINRGEIFEPNELVKETAVALVQKSVNAYNAGNLEAYLEPFSDSVEFYFYPNSLMGKGKNIMRKYFADNTKEFPHIQITERMVYKNTMVVDKENLFFKDGGKMESMRIYEIWNNKITSVKWYLVLEKR